MIGRMKRCELCGTQYSGLACPCDRVYGLRHRPGELPVCGCCKQRCAPQYMTDNGLCAYCTQALAVMYDENGAPLSARQEALVREPMTYDEALAVAIEKIQSGVLGRSVDVTTDEIEKLRRLFDVMKKRIEKSDKYFRFFAGIYFGDHSIAEQREYEQIMREWKADLKGKKNR